MAMDMEWGSREDGMEGGKEKRKRRDWCLYVNAYTNVHSIESYAQQSVSFNL